MSYDQQQLQMILEGALLAAGEPLNLNRMFTLFEEHETPEKEQLLEALDALKQSCEGRGFNLIEVASGYRFQVREDLAGWVNRLWEEKPQKYSRALLETLALIAYRQPITRGDIEEVRGVAVSSHIIKTLVERDWVKVVGHRDVPGRPALYATTRQFLDYFNLKSLDELPTLGELRDIDSLNETLEFDSLPPEVQEALNAAEPTAAKADNDEDSAHDGNKPADEAGSQNVVDADTAALQEVPPGEPAGDVSSEAALEAGESEKNNDEAERETSKTIDTDLEDGENDHPIDQSDSLFNVEDHTETADQIEQNK